MMILKILILVFIASAACFDDSIYNITRVEDGDVFHIKGGDCGVTRCNEVSSGTAFGSRPPGSGPPCGCRCRPEVPLFREDLQHCVSEITECSSLRFGSESPSTKVPLVFVPLAGQIVHPSDEINLEDASDAICAVSGAQFLTNTGWSGLRNDEDGDVPFGFFRDEGKVYLKWRGTESTRSKVVGRVLLVRLACRSGLKVSDPCVSFRVPGTPPDTHDVTEVWFSHGGLSADREEEDNEDRTESSMGRAAGVVIILSSIVVIFLYGSLLFIHIRSKNKEFILIDAERPHKEDALPNTKTNPLLTIETFLKEAQTSSFERDNKKVESTSEKLERTKDCRLYSAESSKSLLTNVTVHNEKKDRRRTRQLNSSYNSVEKIPELHVSIVEGSDPIVSGEFHNFCNGMTSPPVGTQRKKLYFNPAFFELQYLKAPPPAAIEFLTKIREVIAIAKTKMLTKRFVPILAPILEEENFASLSPALPFPYESFRKNTSAFSLKRENSRRKAKCSGCPGCTEMKFKKTYLKTFSEKEFCKDCVSNEFKQDIVKKWLDEVPLLSSSDVDTLKQYRKSVGKVNGTPDSINPDSAKKTKQQDTIKITIVGDNSIKRMSVPPPPPPPEKSEIKEEEEFMIPKELKEKMNAVINELSSIRRIEPIMPRSSSPITEVVTPFIPRTVIAVTPKLVIPTPPKYAKHSKPKVLNSKIKPNNGEWSNFEADSLERSNAKRRASLSNIDYLGMKMIENERIHKRRSSIIAMDELEPLKKIQEMNSRLSKSFQEMSAASLAWSDELERLNEAEKLSKYQKPSLVSEIYVSDAKADPSRKLNVQYFEPLTRPGQLVIEVQGPPRRLKVPDYEDFDPDTLDRKPGKLKIHNEINISQPISHNRTIDRIFIKPLEADKKLKFGSLLEIFEAKNKQGLTPDLLIGDYKPPLPPKKNPSMKCQEPESNICTDNNMKFRITRSEPYSSFDKSNPLSIEVGEKRRFTTFGSMEFKTEHEGYHSLDANYENYQNEIDLRAKSETSPVKRIVKRSTKHRNRRVDQNKIKTEDSGYLSSDSNESRRKFILQIRDKDDTIKDVISDTDDLDSIGDARSESGGESVETNSVFFGSYRRMSLLNTNHHIDYEQTEDSGFHGEIPRKGNEIVLLRDRPISAYKKMSTFDKL